MNLRDYEILYDLPAGEYQGGMVEGIRTVTIRAGRSLEVLCYPRVKRIPEAAKREAKRRRSTAAMERINQRNLKNHVMRLAEINFTARAMVFTGTYEYLSDNDIGLLNREDVWREWEARGLPQAVEDVRRHVRNFLGKIRRRMAEPGGLKWMLRIEEKVKHAELGLPPAYHIHMLMECGGLNQDDVQALWPFGFSRCDRFDIGHDGANRIAEYITKNKQGGRWFSHSRNLKMPTVTVSDRKISRRRAVRVAEDVRYAGREIMEKLHPGYRLMEEPRVTYSDFMPGAYIYCRMRRRD